MDRVLVFTCCDEKYSHFIPLFCASLLWSNSNIDIEIWTNVNSLSKEEEDALEKLREMYSDSKILIKYSSFDFNEEKFFFNGKKVYPNTLRFLVEPILKNKYTYISDIDIISLDKDFYLSHIFNMSEYNTDYSNIVRPNTKRLTGLHFVKTDFQYPIDIEGIDIEKNDEQVLYDIVSKKLN